LVIRLVFLSIILLTASGVFAVCNGMESCVSCHAGCITSQNYSTDHGALHQPAFYMPDFVLAPHQMISLITQILSGGVGYSYDAQIAPRVVHFEDGEKLGNLFEKYCGSCHRVLTDKYGGLGSGVQAPNLSGLLSEFYPANYKNNQRWNADGVRIWVKNPRKIRPLTMMPPQIVNEQELVKLVDDTWGHD